MYQIRFSHPGITSNAYFHLYYLLLELNRRIHFQYSMQIQKVNLFLMMLYTDKGGQLGCKVSVVLNIIQQLFQVKMENVSMTHSEYVSNSVVYKSPKQPRTQDKSLNADFESIFFENVNRSYLAKLSGTDKSMMKKQKIYKRSAVKSVIRKRIDFQTYQGMETEQIYKSTFFKAQWDLFEVVRLLENTDTEVDITDENDRFLCCAGPRSRVICKAKIAGETQLELIKSVAGNDCGLFFGINFDTVKAQIFYHQLKTTSQIIIKAGNFSLVIEPFDKRAGRWWNRQLQKMTQAGLGTQLPLRVLKNNPHFYKNRYQTQQYFLQHCQNGDMLLFQDSHFFAKAQRFITRSQFDHVGIVVRDKKHGILIFQSNTSSGVCLTPWKYVSMFEWYKTIPRLTWRRLHTERNLEFDKQLQDFVIRNLPRQFHFSLAKLAADQSFIMVNDSRREGELQSGHTNGYFCSELAAATYKHMGLLASNRSSSNYLPASRYYPLDFSQKGQIQLQVGHLGEQTDIVFDGEER